MALKIDSYCVVGDVFGGRFAFQNITKKSVKLSVWTAVRQNLNHKQESPRNIRERFTLLCG